VRAPFTHTRASFGLNTALPANCSLPFNSYLSVPQYCLISNSFLKVTVTVPANTQPMQYAPIFMFDSIDLLNADGRSLWQARPESTFVYINQCMEADLKLAAKNLVLADCADAATAGRPSSPWCTCPGTTWTPTRRRVGDSSSLCPPPSVQPLLCGGRYDGDEHTLPVLRAVRISEPSLTLPTVKNMLLAAISSEDYGVAPKAGADSAEEDGH
jgi:hypothetical protein